MNGQIIGISGPTVTTDLTDLKLYERVLVGHRQLTGEVVRLEAAAAVIQIYEESRGLAVGEPVTGLGMPLSVTLGPGLLASMYDGLQRPLQTLNELTGPFLHSTGTVPSLDLQESWNIGMYVNIGDSVQPGDCIGFVCEGSFEHPIHVPESVAGRVARVANSNCRLEEPICVLEGGEELFMYHTWPVRVARPYRKKFTPGRPIITGQRVIDFLFPFARGGTVIIPGGFGAGKTILEQTIAKFADVDIVIYAGCGERGNEMSELIDDFRQLTDSKTGRPLAERTVLVVNTSNMPVAARESSIYTAVTMGEYYRDLGYDVLLLADSLSRWAEALREISSSLEEMPGEEGYPTYLASSLASFCERAGVVESLAGRTGSLSMVLSASPPGEDFTEPVTQALLRTCGTLLMLDSSLAHARHFPAINWAHSYSLYEEQLLPHFIDQTSEEWIMLRDYCRDILLREESLKEIVEIVGIEGLQDPDRLLMLTAEKIRIGFLGQNVFSQEAHSAPAATLQTMREIAAWHDQIQARLKENTSLSEILLQQ
jgi:V/A-type H+-transporting ATPase subunit A